MLTSKDQEILRLTSPVKIVDSKAFDVEDQPLTCIETLSGLKYIIEPKKGILTDNEILKYAPDSMAAAKIRIKNDVATMDDYYLAYSTVPWKLASYYVIIFMIIVPLISILSNWLILLFIVLLLVPIYNVKRVLDIKTRIKLNKTGNKQDYSNNTNNSKSDKAQFIKYEKEIIELKEEFTNKKINAETLIEKRFAPPQLTYDKFMSTVENAERVFDNEYYTAIDLVRYSDDYSSDMEEQIKAKIKTLKVLIKQLDNLIKELLENLSKDNSSDEEIKNIIEEMDRLIDSVSLYD
ncbi:hypothetical protein [Methanosphaera sp.]|uniref:hypothetical protein n=1 Tax=Methanosphaera sp. TaxID=2666342 RepID=UPI002E779727|nr:hypothetical protein [Methanosphaera sp.]MEE1116965.1 hypothetical protein [Methanosphaera sp.]